MTDLVPFSGRTLSEAASELGEGPTFDPGTGTAWWFNITGRELHELHLESGRKAIHPLPFLGSVLAVIDPLRQLIASDQGLFVRDTESSKLGHFA
ncbi:SMP-30/gluconolactonase/LRE family protein, partial [Sinorhizobium meliloti]